MKTNKTAVLVLAAGRGTRMAVDKPKVLIELAGKPLLLHILATIQATGISDDSITLIVGYRHEEVISVLNNRYTWVLQQEQLGTGHAVLTAREALENFSGTVMVVCGDVPLLTPDILTRFLSQHHSAQAACSVLTTGLDNPFGYGRIIRADNGKIAEIVEEKDATDEQKLINEINTGLFCFDSEGLFDALKNIKNNNSSGEYYLTDVVKIMIRDGRTVHAVYTKDSQRVLGVNTLEELQTMEKMISAGASQ